jgi:hypothetical protein
MFILDTALVGGIRFVLDKLATVVNQEMNDPERWRSELLEIQLKLENGEITEEEFAAREAEVLAQLRALNPESSGVVAGNDEVSSIQIETPADKADWDEDR